MDNSATNFNPLADCDDATCTYNCNDPGNCDDGDCSNGLETWDGILCACALGTAPTPCSDDGDCSNGVESWNISNCLCDVVATVLGCTDNSATNFNPLADCEDGTCTYDCLDPGNCDDVDCENGNEFWDDVNCECVSENPPDPCSDDGDCENGIETWNSVDCICDTATAIVGCLDVTALNFDPSANCEDNSCFFECDDLEDCDEICELYFPEAFSPNRDGVNDTFRILGGEYCLSQDLKVSVYNRWGKLVYLNNKYLINELGWDGTYNGNKSEIGVYVYLIQHMDNAGSINKTKGHITLI